VDSGLTYTPMSQHNGHTSALTVNDCSPAPITYINTCALTPPSRFSAINAPTALTWWMLWPWAPSYQLWTHTTYRTITIQKHPRFCPRGTPMPILTIFQFPYCFRRALSPYMVQEMLTANGSASKVLRTHVQHKGHSRLISSTSTALWTQEQCLKSSCTLYCTLYCTQCHIHHSSI
jgi:hypothetical protein